MSVDELPFPAVRHGASGNALFLKRTHGAAFDVAPGGPISSGGGSGSFGESGSVRDDSVGDGSVCDGSGDNGGLPGVSANTGGLRSGSGDTGGPREAQSLSSRFTGARRGASGSSWLNQHEFPHLQYPPTKKCLHLVSESFSLASFLCEWPSRSLPFS